MVKVTNITLNADRAAIEKARQKARREGKSLNTKFREWLKKYIKPEEFKHDYARLMDSLKHVAPGRTFTREEANER